MGKMEMRMALLEPANNDDENKQLVEGYDMQQFLIKGH